MTTKEELRQQWATRVSEYHASGLTLKAWCAAHDCTVDQMKYWLYKSKQHASSTLSESAPATRFLPLAVVDKTKREPLVLYIGPAKIELHAGFDSKLLREVVYALAEAPC
jgi:hypothetical protein